MAEILCHLPRIFIEDREDRDLETWRHGPFRGAIAICWPTLEQAREMLSDADYQADHTDAEGLDRLRRSARKAREILSRQINRHLETNP
jgi:hypothetical protein